MVVIRNNISHAPVIYIQPINKYTLLLLLFGLYRLQFLLAYDSSFNRNTHHFVLYHDIWATGEILVAQMYPYLKGFIGYHIGYRTAPHA